jgi:hypothetical protein
MHAMSWRALLLKYGVRLSVLLFVVIAVLWVRSYFALDRFKWVRSDGGRYYVVSSLGRVQFAVDAPFAPDGSSGFTTGWSHSVGVAREIEQRHFKDRKTYVDRFGFTVETWRGAFTQLYWVAVPSWFLIIPTVILPTIAVMKGRGRHRRLRRGLCGNCGYDISATPDRCPECGTVVEEMTAIDWLKG